MGVSKITTVQDVMDWWWRSTLNAGWEVEYRSHPNYKGLPAQWEPLRDWDHTFSDAFQYRVSKEIKTNEVD